MAGHPRPVARFLPSLLLLLSAPPAPAADPAPSPAAPRQTVAGFFGGGSLDLDLRAYYLDRLFQETFLQPEIHNLGFVVGGGVVYRTGVWHGASLGFSVYTSQNVYCPEDKGGTSLLQDGHSYAALAETYLQWKGGETTVRLFRQRFEGPMMGSRDFRMVPYAWEAYTVENRSVPGLAVQASYVTKVKDWTSSTFVPLGQWLGLGDASTPTAFLGLTYDTPRKGLHAEGWLYLTKDVAAQVYAQVDGKLPLGRDVWLVASGQLIYQDEIGDALYRPLETRIGGGRLAVTWKGIEGRFAGTVANRANEYLNLFGYYPGFTSIMEEDNNLAGEISWLVGLTVDLGPWGLPGLTVNWDRTKAWVRDPPLGMSGLDQFENDFEVNYRFQGALKGLRLRARYAEVDSALDQGTLFGRDMKDFRLNLEYRLPISLAPKG